MVNQDYINEKNGGLVGFVGKIQVELSQNPRNEFLDAKSHRNHYILAPIVTFGLLEILPTHLREESGAIFFTYCL